MTGQVYLERGQQVTVLARWGTPAEHQVPWVLWHRPSRRAPRNVLIERVDGTRVVRPFRGLRRVR